MKKLLLSICIALCVITAPLAAFEWGGLLTDESGILTPDFSNMTIKQSNGIAFWVNAPFGEDYNSNFSAEALYKLNMYIPKGGDLTLEHIADVPLLKLSGDVPTSNGLLSYSVGRFSYVDKTSAIYSNTCDGASFEYSLPLVKFGAFAGYTGLLNALNVSMYSEKDYKVYNLAYPYVPVSAYFELPIAGNQSFGFQGSALIDLGSIKQNAYYASATLSGPVANFIYYSLVTTFGSVNFKSLMNYTSLSFIAFPTENIFINLGAEFGSAEDQFGFGEFYSIATSAGGKIAPKLGITLATSKMSLDLTGKYNLVYTGSSYKGDNIEAIAGLVYNIFSDFQVGLNFKGYIYPDQSENTSYIGYLSVALAF